MAFRSATCGGGVRKGWNLVTWQFSTGGGSNEEGWRSPPLPSLGIAVLRFDKELAWCESEEEAKRSPSGLRVVVQTMILVGLVRARVRVWEP